MIGEYASGNSGGVDQTSRATIIAGFAPRTAGRLSADGTPLDADQYDILLTTDVLAEGVNLQQAAEIINYDLPWNSMRIVQRHGRVDRIGSEHPEIHLGVFFPTEHLDQYLKLEHTLIRKLRQADVAVGTGKVLPGVSNLPPQEHYDADAIATELEELVNSSGGSAAGSGEEYRRRLLNAVEGDSDLRESLETLPLGIGSGFASSTAARNTYVFCMRMGDSDRVWFRNVYATPNWEVALDDEGNPAVEDDTLVSLVTADPRQPTRTRTLTPEAFSGAYGAWEVARDHAFSEMRPSSPRSSKFSTTSESNRRRR